MQDGLVSIIMPVYNREQYVAAAIESVLQQTYKKYELIIVDDGSTDSSLQVIRSFQKYFPDDRLIIISQQNRGPSYAKNVGIEAGHGQYIAFLDSDDFWHEEKLAKQLPLFNTDREVAFTYTGYYTIDENGSVLQECLPDSRFSGNIYDKLWKYKSNISGGTIIAEREKLLAVGLFDSELKGAENQDLRLRLSKLGEVFFVETPLYYYRRHRHSLTADQPDMRYYRGLLLEKHFGKQPVKNRLYRTAQAKLLYEDGMVEFSCKRYSAAFNCFMKSITFDPLYFRSYSQLARCCMGKNINEWLAKCKKCIGNG